MKEVELFSPGNYRVGFKVILLAGSRDFGRCQIASRMPVSLWPVFGQPAIERVIKALSNQGITDACVCSEDNIGPFKMLSASMPNMQLKFCEESLRAGTAGCLRDAMSEGAKELIIIMPASIVYPPDIGSLLSAHIERKADLTAVFNQGYDKTSPGTSTGIYVCNTSVLEHIPTHGYYDIKESLIPELVQKSKRVRYLVLPHNVGNFRDRQGYLDAIGSYLANAVQADINLHVCECGDKNIVWKGSDVTIECGARIYGRVVLLDDVHIESGAVIFGPTILGHNVSIGKYSLVANSVIWDNSRVAENCEIQRCLIDYQVLVPANSVTEEKSIVFKPQGRLVSFFEGLSKTVRYRVDKLSMQVQTSYEKTNKRTPNKLRRHGIILPWLAAGFISITFLWSYWPGIMDLWNIWQRSDEYSSGLLVPFLAGYILWSRRKQIAGIRMKPCLWGLPVFVGAQALKFFGLFFVYASAERLSIVLSIAALVLLLLGWEFFRKLSTILLFLLLMLPWPTRVQTALALPLQQWATSSAVFCLEVVGYEVVREGNVIHIGNATVAVAEACNGLRMITAFFVISGLVVLLVERAWWEKLIVFVSSLPIALFCNTLRLAATAIAFTVLQGEYWEKIFHDFGGYAMMPLALAIVVGEFWFLSKLTVAPKQETSVIINAAKS